jgi:hypothetical protein
MAFEVELRCPCTLVPGSFAHARLDVPAPPALLVSVDAVTTRKGEPAVLVVDNGHGSFRRVELGATDGKVVRVLAGLREGEQAVLFPGDQLVDGAPLRAVLPGEK